VRSVRRTSFTVSVEAFDLQQVLWSVQIERCYGSENYEASPGNCKEQLFAKIRLSQVYFLKADWYVHDDLDHRCIRQHARD
jgi:hypothetical protein